MKLTSNDIRQLIKEELDKLLKESSKKEKIPMTAPGIYIGSDEYKRRKKEVERNLERRKEWRGYIDPRYNLETCPEWIKNRYHDREGKIKKLCMRTLL